MTGKEETVQRLCLLQGVVKRHREKMGLLKLMSLFSSIHPSLFYCATKSHFSPVSFCALMTCNNKGKNASRCESAFCAIRLEGMEVSVDNRVTGTLLGLSQQKKGEGLMPFHHLIYIFNPHTGHNQQRTDFLC